MWLYCECIAVVSRTVCAETPVDLNRIELFDFKQQCYLLTPNGFYIFGFNAIHFGKREDFLMTLENLLALACFNVKLETFLLRKLATIFPICRA